MVKQSVLILTDQTEFSRTLMAAWQLERHAPELAAPDHNEWSRWLAFPQDLIVLGPLKDGRLGEILQSLPLSSLILHCSTNTNEAAQLRARHPHVLLLPYREDWVPMLLLVAGECLKRLDALRNLRQAEQRAACNEGEATLGRYMKEMRHSMNNALTSMLGNAELLLIEPGQLSKQSLAQIKTIHSMALRINEIMQRFSSLAKEVRESENASQAETEELSEAYSPRA